MAAGFEVQTKADSTRQEFGWLEENEGEAHGKQCYSCILGPIKSAMNSYPYSQPHPSLLSEHFPWQAVLWRVSTTAEINNSENQWHHWWDQNWEQRADFTSQPNKRRGQPGPRGFQHTVLANPPLCGCYAGWKRSSCGNEGMDSFQNKSGRFTLQGVKSIQSCWGFRKGLFFLAFIELNLPQRTAQLFLFLESPV